MDAHDLRVFEAVARLGGMGRAAAELNTVQSNVTALCARRRSLVPVRRFSLGGFFSGFPWHLLDRVWRSVPGGLPLLPDWFGASREATVRKGIRDRKFIGV